MSDYFKKINKVNQRVEEKEIPKGQTYRARFIAPGAVGYKEGTYLLTSGVLDSFAYTLKRCPVLVGHQDVLDYNDMLEKAVGYVTNVERLEDGSWAADFVVFCPKAIKKVENGEVPYVSCAYDADLSAGPVVVNNVEYKREILGGEMKHLALVKNPRYNGTEVWKNSDDDYFISEGSLYNEKENTMNIFKKVKTEVDKDSMVSTSTGDKTIEDLVKEYDSLVSKTTEQENQIKDLEAEKAAAAEAAAKAAEEAAAAVAKQTQGQPASTDESLKQDLTKAGNSQEDKVIVQIPTIKM
ncbi:MAG: DUF2213 domain-containing protein [Alphaproteobacteria bacterium]|nr:DUF2213 domain-containing protein [Alphaproteobacteria bacterium]